MASAVRSCRALARSAALAALGSLASCGSEVSGLPDSDPIPVVQAILITGETRQTFALSWSEPAGRPRDGGRVPAASEVHLWVIGPDGDSVAVVADSTRSDGYVATLDVRPGAMYRLAGTVGTVPIAATTTVPTVAVVEPRSNPLRLRAVDDFVSTRVDYVWSSPDAKLFGVIERMDDPRFTLGAYFLGLDGRSGRSQTQDTTGMIQLTPAIVIDSSDGQFHGRPGPGTTELVMLAYDATSAAYIQSDTENPARNNITGGFGLFGSAATARWTVIWE